MATAPEKSSCVGAPIKERAEALLALSRSPPADKPVLWYFSHLYGRSEIVRMTLTFAEIDFTFAGFSNAEWAEIKPGFLEGELSWGLPLLQIDGLHLSQTKSIVRYVGQKGGLYPPHTALGDVWRVESILEGADDLFAMLIKYHYNKYNTVAGATAAFDPADREQYGRTLGDVVHSTFLRFNHMLGQNAAGPEDYLVGGQLTIADILVCHYRWVCQLPEFWPLVERAFADPGLADFRRYYASMSARHFAAYFATRYGSGGDPSASARGAAEAEGVAYPFEW